MTWAHWFFVGWTILLVVAFGYMAIDLCLSDWSEEGDER